MDKKMSEMKEQFLNKEVQAAKDEEALRVKREREREWIALLLMCSLPLQGHLSDQ